MGLCTLPTTSVSKQSAEPTPGPNGSVRSLAPARTGTDPNQSTTNKCRQCGEKIHPSSFSHTYTLQKTPESIPGQPGIGKWKIVEHSIGKTYFPWYLPCYGLSEQLPYFQRGEGARLLLPRNQRIRFSVNFSCIQPSSCPNPTLGHWSTD